MKGIDIKRVMLVRPRTQCGWGYMWAPLAINLEYIAAYIENDVDEIIIVNQEFDDSDIADKIHDFNPDLFGVTMSATEHDSGLALCRTAKKMGIPTAVGGYHPTAIPDQMLANPEVDYVFRGESELTMKEFIIKSDPAGVEGISYRDGANIVHNPPPACRFRTLTASRSPQGTFAPGTNAKGGWMRKAVIATRYTHQGAAGADALSAVNQ